ncbi:MAG: hypothetical protein ACOYMQ_08010 [Pseudanabaena sp.]|jgi:hypothetical protein
MLKHIAKKLLIFLVAILIVWNGLFFNISNAYAKAQPLPVLTENSEKYNWNEIDKLLVEGLEKARSSTEEFASSELDSWVAKAMKNVDRKFLDWYFSYINQKGMEDGVPFAWLLFKLDESLKVFRTEMEKDLNADDIIKNRLIEDFNKKFNELIITEDFQEDLKERIERIVKNYVSSIGLTFSMVKSHYHVPDLEWENHLGQLSTLVYNSGTSKGSLSADSLNSNLLTKISVAATAVIGTKLTAKFAGKAAAKFAGKAAAKFGLKAGGTIALKTAAKFADPLLVIGFIAWDIWDYNKMVDKSRPEMRKNILDYLTELKLSILSSPENSIISAIYEVQKQLEKGITSLSL